VMILACQRVRLGMVLLLAVPGGLNQWLYAQNGSSGTSPTTLCSASSRRVPRRLGAGVLLRDDLAISMDCTVFLLSSAKEHLEPTHDPKEAMVRRTGALGRVIFAAGAVMVAVFFTLALSGPMPPKEMGIILGVPPDASLLPPVLLPATGQMGLVSTPLGSSRPAQVTSGTLGSDHGMTTTPPRA
jgi:hypothetical protein